MLSYWQVILPFSLICQADGFMRVQGLGSEESSPPEQHIFGSSLNYLGEVRQRL
jgi:hypothetical protein